MFVNFFFFWGGGGDIRGRTLLQLCQIILQQFGDGVVMKQEQN